ncbi:MAG: hypothetical protein PHF84_07515 [bacterium]|nr:hypothetical protein [bacterium]
MNFIHHGFFNKQVIKKNTETSKINDDENQVIITVSSVSGIDHLINDPWIGRRLEIEEEAGLPSMSDEVFYIVASR